MTTALLILAILWLSSIFGAGTAGYAAGVFAERCRSRDAKAEAVGDAEVDAMVELLDKALGPVTEVDRWLFAAGRN